MTSPGCLTGTDRVAEAATKIKADIYINVQGDEPTINPNDIKKVIKAKMKILTMSFVDMTKFINMKIHQV